ncbi:MAG TPA: tetratricopeptide repeat protein [Vicinamibacteria bacterium]|jgi:tetratricopeptide (TPR) repeat protein
MKRRALLVTLAIVAAACAKPTAPRAPEAEGFLFPFARPGEANADEQKRLAEAWKDVISGDPSRAERAYVKLLERHAIFIPAETGLAYTRLRQGRAAEALEKLQSVLGRRADYLPALAGAATAARRLGDAEAAFGFYRRAQAQAPSDPGIARGLAEMKLQVTERRVAAARSALAAGRAEDAIAAYRSALEVAPEVATLRIELANLLVELRDVAGALALLDADPGGDRQVLVREAELLVGERDYNRALEVYRRILARDPRDPDALRGSREVREVLELLRMPEEYRRLPGLPRLTRADLAALVAAKVTALSRLGAGAPKVAIDISGSWAREHIVRLLALDLMDLYPNHTFQPAAIVRRGDLARVAQRILDAFKVPAPAAPNLSDMTRGNLLYYAAARVVGAGLMDLTPTGAFEPWRPVTGEDAVRVIEGLVGLVGP